MTQATKTPPRRSRRAQRPAELVDYLSQLGRRDPGVLLELRFRRPNGPMRQCFESAHEPEALAQTIVWLDRRHDVYIGVLPRVRRTGGKTAVERARMLWVDCDDPEAIAALERFEPAPGMVLESGGGRHAYWPLAAAIDPGEAEERNRRLACALGADARACDTARILRPPATRNHKYRPPRAVELIRSTGEVFGAEEVTGHLPPVSEPRRAAEPERARSGDPLLELAPATYLEALTGLTAGRDGKVSCPFHEDSTPSLHVYQAPADGWFCFGCERGGSVYDLAAALWEINPRGAGFVELRRRLEGQLLGAPR